LKRLLHIPASLQATLLLLATTTAVWKLRIINSANIEDLFTDTIDLYTEHYPMAAYGFSVLRSGHIPLWDPYQLCGLPFLAIPHTGLFYPGNLPYLLFSAGLATEIVLVAHLVFAGLGMWLLGRAFGFNFAGALAGAVTFMWSGWMMGYIHQAALVSGMCWLPVTALLVEKTTRGSRVAPFGLALAVACQLLNGAPEFLLQNMYAGALLALFSLARLVADGHWRTSAVRALVLLACVAAGGLLATPQLLPTLELVPQTVRSAGSLPFAEVIWGWISPGDFLLAGLRTAGHVAVGVLPLFGFALGLGARRLQRPWVFALTVGMLAVLLVFGGSAFRMYYRTPAGQMFRTPQKFLHLYAFAQGLLAGIALTRLEDWRPLPRRALWSKPAWILCLLAIGAGLCWLALHGTSNLYLAGCLALLLFFGAARTAKTRMLVIPALLLLHTANLFLGVNITHIRPSARPEVFDSYISLFERIKQAAGHDRVYISPALRLNPGLTSKQGMLRKVHVVEDYEALSPRRYATFFDHVSGPKLTDWFFAGFYLLGDDSRWPLMDLTSTRFYIVQSGEAADNMLAGWSSEPSTSGFRLFQEVPYVRVYERTGYRPRAYYVPQGRVVDSADAVLATLDSSNFDSRREVLLDGVPDPASVSGGSPAGAGTTSILIDEPERVVIDVEASQSGFLVLTDAFYPGWKAFANGVEVPIYRANYLMRAVPIGAGRTRCIFEYRPASVRYGQLIGVTTAGIMLLLSGFLAYRNYGERKTVEHVPTGLSGAAGL
jgi:hypothetical protein